MWAGGHTVEETGLYPYLNRAIHDSGGLFAGFIYVALLIADAL